MQIDPLATLLIGALGASILGIFGAWIQGKREHSRWLISKRFDAYEAYVQLVDKYVFSAKLGINPKTGTAIAEALEPISEAVSTISLLGPAYVNNAALDLQIELAETIRADHPAPGFEPARLAFVRATRRALKVSSWPQRLVRFLRTVRRTD